MIRERVYLVIFLSILSIYGSNLICQSYCDNKYDHIWIMGGIDIDTTEDRYGGFEINFNTIPVSINKNPKYYQLIFQNASMSTRTGNLIFYTNGCLVLNVLDDQMENGDSLNPGNLHEDFCLDIGYLGFQNMVVLPDSYNDSIYYLFHIDHKNNLDPNLPFNFIPENIYCTTIDMAMYNGLGMVRDKNRVVVRDTTMLGGPMSAVKHANGMDWWIITPNRWTNSHNIILVDKDGPHFDFKQHIGATPDSNSTGGQGKFSPDGSRFAWYHPDNGIYLYDFDRQEGRLSNFMNIEIPPFSGVTGGLEFSPSGKFLYVNHDTSLFQVDLMSSDIQASLTHIADYDKFVDVTATPFFYMERTPDHRIFLNIISGSQWLHVIQEPDKKGKACRFEQHAIKLPTVNNFTLPHFPNYRLGPIGEPLCDSIWVSTVYPEQISESKYKIGPNPTSGYFRIFQKEDSEKEDFKVSIIGMNGRIFLHSKESELDLTGLPPGVYFCKIIDASGYVQIEKIVTLE